MEELSVLAKADGITEMQSYDTRLLCRKTQKTKFDFNDEELKPYFQLDKVQSGFRVMGRKTFRVRICRNQ